MSEISLKPATSQVPKTPVKRIYYHPYYLQGHYIENDNIVIVSKVYFTDLV